MRPSAAWEAAPEAGAYRWAALAACTLLIGAVSVVWHSFSVFLVALTEAFPWSRAEAALGFSIFVICSGLTGPNAGMLIRRFGAGRVVLAGGMVLAAGLAATSRVSTLWQFYLCFGLLTGVGFSLSGWIPVVTVLQTWFRRRLGAATGIASAGVGVGIMTLVPAIQALILAAGWRTAYLAMAAGALAVTLTAALLLREGPLARTPAAGMTPFEDDPYLVDRDWAARPWSLHLALCTSRYWLLLVGFFLASFSSQQLLAHHVAYLRSAGVAALTAAGIVGVVGIASIPAKITWGVASDRIGREPTYTIGASLVAAAVAVLWLVPVLGPGWLPHLYAVLIGAGYASSATLPPIVAADLFRGPAYAAIFGGIALASNSGSGVGAWLAGLIFDHTGSYHLAFVIAATGVAVSAACVWLAAPRRVRRVTGRRPAAQAAGEAARSLTSGSPGVQSSKHPW